LGGMHDEAEIRGHRKTYIGAMPGRIIQYIRRAGVQNPVIMLDEVDKIGKDFRGDPSSALLEVLDPEQNKDFRDNYLEVAFDLSRVTFLATSNTTHTIPDALLDRMELIHLPGYINPEKVEIAKRYLIPRQIEANGLKRGQLRFFDPVIDKMIDHYTFESGVRNLEQHVAKICRKVARRMAAGTETKRVAITVKNIESYLGPRKIFNEDISKSDAVGIVNGLAYTVAGGDVLSVEAVIMKGSGNQKMTGQLGEVMKESVSTAISYLRSRAAEFEIETERFKDFDIHLHFPAASIPKDGPSAGVSIVTAVASLLTDRMVRHDFAMTGEITLRGKVLAVGGIREKVTAAKRYGITNIILPASNQGDVEKTPDYVREGINFHFVNSVDDVFNLALIQKNS
jgi:ATP-dependent Lon protease